MVLGVPTGDGVVVVLVEEQPPRLGVSAAAPHQCKVTAKLLALQVEVQISGFSGGDRIRSVGDRPGAPIPDDHIPAPVFAARNHPFEVEVLQRVVLHVNCHALHIGVECRPLRHRPAQQDAGCFQTEVVVQPRCAMTLHHEPMTVLVGSR